MRRLGWRLLRREWRAGGLWLVVLAVAVGVAAVTTVAVVSDRVERGLKAQAAALLGADAVLESDRPIPARFVTEAEAAGLALSWSLQFPSMAFAGGRGRLAWVVAVRRGGHGGAAQALSEPPPPGTVWLEPALAHALGVGVGDSLQLGAMSFRVAGLAQLQPLGGAMATGLAPRLLMRREDVAATGLVTPASRVVHRLSLAGEVARVSALTARWRGTLPAGMRLLTPEQAAPALEAAFDRGMRFLFLAALSAVLLGCLAVALAARHFAEGHRRHAALLRCFGARRAQVERLFLWQLSFLGAGAALLGVVLGLVAQQGVLWLLSAVVALELPPPGWRPLVLGVVVAGVTLLAFAWPPLRALGRVPVMTVLRRQAMGESGGRRGWVVVGLLGGVALALGLLGGWGPVALAVLLGLALLLALAARVLLLLLARLPLTGVARVALAGLVRRPALAVIQVAGFALALLTLLTLTWIRGDLLQQWAASLPEDAPDHFLINIRPDQRVSLAEELQALGVDAPVFHPMIRGRPVAVNGRPLAADVEGEGRAQRLRRREANLTYMMQLPADNRLVAGQWDPTQPGWSLEVGFAEILGVSVGDVLSFDIAGERVTAPVTSLREVVWESLRPNFFVIATPPLLRERPSTWMTAVRIPQVALNRFQVLAARYPNVTVVDVRGLLLQVRGVMERVGQAVQLVFVFTLVAAGVVMLAAWRFNRARRRREQALLRVMGARRRQLERGRRWEAGLLGGLAGGLALICGLALSGWVVQLLGMSGGWWWGWFAGALAGAAMITAAGLALSRGDETRPPWRDLTAE